MSETIEKDGYRIEIEQDEYAENPLHCMDFLCKFLVFHSRYSFGHKHEFKDPGAVQEYKKAQPEDLWLPLYLYDHSGLTISLNPFSCPWDSGQVGWVWASRKDILQNFLGKILTKKLRKQALEVAAAEVKIVDDYLTGNVHQYRIYDAEDEIQESCGYYGDEKECKEEALRMLEHIKDCARKAENAKPGPPLPGLEIAVTKKGP
jgi:hypothetical protein